jgi:hypothetical protein
MWDSFTSGILLSSIWHGYDNIEDNDFAKLKYRYITMVTSNKPYRIHDGSNPFLIIKPRLSFNLGKEEFTVVMFRQEFKIHFVLLPIEKEIAGMVTQRRLLLVRE